MNLITKVIPNWDHYLSTAFRISLEYYEGEENRLARTGQSNRFSGNVCQDTLCLIMKLIEKEKVERNLKSVMNRIEEGIITVLFVDDADIISKGKNAVENMQKMLEIHNRLCIAIEGYIEDNIYIYIYIYIA